MHQHYKANEPLKMGIHKLTKMSQIKYNVPWKVASGDKWVWV